MRSIDIEVLKRRGVPEFCLAVLRLRLSGWTRREVMQSLGIRSRGLYERQWQRMAAILRNGMDPVEQSIWNAERRRVGDVRLYVHLIEHDVEEVAVWGPVWRRAALGRPSGQPLVDDTGRSVLPRAAAFRAEDVLA